MDEQRGSLTELDHLQRRVQDLERRLGDRDAAPRRPRRTRRIVAALLAISLVVPGLALATDSFSDVSDANVFHDAINAIFGARITSGCGGGEYCPSEPVTREQMAAFMQRGFGRVAHAEGQNGDDWQGLADGVVGTVTLRTGGTPGGYGLALVFGEATYLTDESGICPCEAKVVIESQQLDDSGQIIYQSMPNILTQGHVMAGLSASHVFVVPTATTVTFELGGTVEYTLQPSPENFAEYRWNLSAVYIPFDALGENATPLPAP